jgi:Fibronectin type III domain
MRHLFLILALLSLPPRADALTVTVLTPSSVTVAWDSSVDATQYVVQQGTKSGGPYVDAVWTSATTETISGLAPGGTYYWIVRAVNAAGLWSTPSNEVSITLPTGPTQDDCAPFTGLYAVSVNPTSLLFTGSKGPGSLARLDFQVASPNSPITRVVVAIDGAIVPPILGCPTEGVDCGAVMSPLAGMWFTLPASGTHTLIVTAWNRKGCSKATSYGRGLVVP